MGDFNRAKRPFSGGGRSFGGGNRGGFGGGRSFGGGRDRDGGRPQMHKATCSECGKECELPFRPSGDRPVFCSTCFEKQNGGSERPNRFGGDRRERSDRPRFEDRQMQMHDATCAKCGAKCQVPFKPMPGKDVFCDNCFHKKGSKDSGELMSEIKGLHVKLDRLMKLLAPNASVEKVEKVVVEKKEKTKTKPVAKKALGKKKK